MVVYTGLDVYLEMRHTPEKVGLLANSASQTLDGRSAYRALVEAGVNVGAIFAPEHGYFAVGAAGESVADGYIGTIPLYSLYGAQSGPKQELLQGLSMMIIDLQGVGLRWYTFLATMRAMIAACATAGVSVLVLDRPNPQGGVVVEGPIAEPEYFSLVAPGPLTIRHGLTMCETAFWMNADLGADVQTVQMEGWRRDMWFGDTGLLWNAPSPGIPHAETALVYSGTCLIEGLNVSEGRGTALPFEQIGAPFVHAETLADDLNGLNLSGVQFRPTWFRPAAGKYAGERCEGVRLFVTNPREYRGFEVGLYVVESLLTLYPQSVQWLDHEGKNIFDRLMGTARVRLALQDHQPVEDILDWLAPEEQAFQAASMSYWLYD